MDYYLQKFGHFLSIFKINSSQFRNEKSRKISRLNVYFEFTYRILSWEDYTSTLTSFLLFNFLFWLTLYLQLKLYGVVFLVLLMAFMWDTYYASKQPEISISHYSVDLDLFNRFHTIFSNIILYRKESPSTFCVGISFLFLMLSILARSISGYVLFYLIVLLIFFLPLLVTLFPDEYQMAIEGVCKIFHLKRDVLAEEDLIPFICNKDFSKRDPELESLLTDRTADSVTNSLISDMQSMPSFMDLEDKDEIEEGDLIPQMASTAGVSYTPGDQSTDSDSDHKGIHFDASCVTDSSSEEENMFAEGLKVRRTHEKEISTGESSFGNIASALQTNVIVSAIKSAIESKFFRERKDSSSESEFEFVSRDDIDK